MRACTQFVCNIMEFLLACFLINLSAVIPSKESLCEKYVKIITYNTKNMVHFRHNFDNILMILYLIGSDALINQGYANF